ncbi:hypothetical protein BANT10_01176 [Brevibacterium antiquum]|uniref:Uncharacterized protein n=2 Tax=Brevibacterium antiquum TaxID=234835 RepID=A0A2H1IPJ1_9MICO|nr:hypothetical protein BANT10_01176 [Brevibacterium antiquum]
MNVTEAGQQGSSRPIDDVGAVDADIGAADRLRRGSRCESGEASVFDLDINGGGIGSAGKEANISQTGHHHPSTWEGTWPPNGIP